MAANMYRVGDYVYFETSSTSPFQIRRIEELNKTPNGNVEAKVMCFYRRRDISSSLIMLADKHQSLLEENGETEEKLEEATEKGTHQLKHRELFLSRQVETLPATHIRGKCVVTLLNETEALTSYLNKDDMFFYSLVYDPQQKTLLADKGEIRVGSKFQAEITSLLAEGEDTRRFEDLEALIWQPCPDNGITDKEIDQFQIIAKSVGTFARALDCTSTVRQPSLHMSAAAASRDISLFNAMHTLHKYEYDVARAVTSLVPDGGPVLCKDEMEEWSASEANLFEEAIDKYGKDFNDIRQDFLPWKSLKSIIEYYYMWKTTDRYVQQKRIKAAEAESKLKQVYIPNYNKPNPALLTGKMNGGDQLTGRACESCYSSHSNLWYSWGPTHLQCRLCSSCWSYWKKYGGLKMPTRLDGERPAPNQRPGQFTIADRGSSMNIMRTHRCTIAGCGKEFKLKTHLARHLATAHGLAIRPGSPKPVMKTRAAFCLVTTALTRLSRRLCKDILRPKHAARLPFIPINIAAIKQECQLRLEEGGKYVPNIKYRTNISMEPVLSRLGIDILQDKPHLLGRHGTKGKPNERVNRQTLSSGHPSIMRKRGYEQSNGVDTPLAKRPHMSDVALARVPLRVPTPIRNSVVLGMGMNRRNKVRVARGNRTPMISWIDAPDDVFFLATDATRKLRKKVTQMDHKRAGRNPWKRLLLKPTLKSEKEVVVLD